MIAEDAVITVGDVRRLESRWLKAERQYRSQVAEARAAGTPWSCMQGHADGMAECRLELLEASGLEPVGK